MKPEQTIMPKPRSEEDIDDGIYMDETLLSVCKIKLIQIRHGLLLQGVCCLSISYTNPMIPDCNYQYFLIFCCEAPDVYLISVYLNLIKNKFTV